MKTRRFFFHYNKPVSKKEGRNFLTLHYKGECHLVNRIVCDVSTESHDQKKQPHCIIRGWANDVTIYDSMYGRTGYIE